MRRWLPAFFKSITISGIVALIGLALMAEDRMVGALFLAAYSTFMVVRAYRKPIPLGVFSALLPGLMALFTYAVMSSVLEPANSDLPAAGFLVGIVPGIIMGATHRVYPENGRIWAKKSFLYLVIWGITYIITQIAGLGGMREISGGALALSGFSSASLMMLSLFLLTKYKKEKRRLVTVASAGTAAVIVCAFSMTSLLSTSSDLDNKEPSAEHALSISLGSPAAAASACPELSQRCESLINHGFIDLSKSEKAEHTACWEMVDVIKKCRKQEKAAAQRKAEAARKSSQPAPAPRSLEKKAVPRQSPSPPAESAYPGQERDNAPAGRTGRTAGPHPEVAEASAVCSLIQLLVAAIMSAMLSGTSAAGTLPQPETPPTGRTPPPSASPLINPETGEPLIEEDGKYWVWNQWVGAEEAGRWVRERQAAQAARQAEIDQRFNDERRDRQVKSHRAHRARGDRYDTATDTWYTADYDAARQAEAAAAAQKQFNAEMLEKNRNHAADRLRTILTQEGEDPAVIDDLIAAGRWHDVCDMFRDRVYQGIKDSVQEHAAERTWATTMQVAAYSAQVVEAASKASIAVLAGPAGLASAGSMATAAGAAGLATGAITGSSEAAQAHAAITDRWGNVQKEYRNKVGSTVAKAFGAGFLSGAKDGVVGVYCGKPGLNKFAKVLIPAGCDATETYLRTGNMKQAGISGGLSVVGDVLGDGVDQISNRYAKEAAGTALSATMGGTGSYLNGGSFGEGAVSGIINRAGSRLGSDLTQNHLIGSSGRNIAAQSSPVDSEDQVRRALADVEAERNRRTPLEDLPEDIRDLYATRTVVQEIDPVTGQVRDTVYVDEKQTVDQLTNTGSSRSTKSADPEVQQAIINTREKKIYGPANEAAIKRVIDKPEIQKQMRPGDQLVMTGFSTPGATPPIGADRDAIMCIARPIPNSDQVQLIQVDRRLWQNEAYDEFYKHTIKHANKGPDGTITPESEPDFFRRKKELEHLRQRPLDDDTVNRVKDQVTKKWDAQIKKEDQARTASGQPKVDAQTRQTRIDNEVKQKLDRLQGQFLSDDQIEARAWAASRNQVFTDPYHMEASRDNSNQVLTIETAPDGTRRLVKAEIGVEVNGTVRPIRDAEGNIRTGAGIVVAQQGRAQGLIDDEGTVAMWKVKSEDYLDGNMPEAVAQSQKGIKQYMKLREGQRLAGAAVPPLKPHVAEAMELLVRAPVDATASADNMQALESAIQSIRRPDPSGLNPDGIPAYPGGVKEALEKLPEQNRMLRAAIHAPDSTSPDVSPVTAHTPSQEGALAAHAARTGMRNAVGPAGVHAPADSLEGAADQLAGNTEPDELERQLRQIDEERARLAQKIAEHKQSFKGEQS